MGRIRFMTALIAAWARAYKAQGLGFVKDGLSLSMEAWIRFKGAAKAGWGATINGRYRILCGLWSSKNATQPAVVPKDRTVPSLSCLVLSKVCHSISVNSRFEKMCATTNSL